MHGLEFGSDSAKSLDANLTNPDPQLIKWIVEKFFGMLNVHNTESISIALKKVPTQQGTSKSIIDTILYIWSKGVQSFTAHYI